MKWRDGSERDRGRGMGEIGEESRDGKENREEWKQR